jgi:hypothetical protein
MSLYQRIIEWSDRQKWKCFKLAWRINYAATVMIETRCTLRQGLQQADAAITDHPFWWQHSIPSEMARTRLREPF